MSRPNLLASSEGEILNFIGIVRACFFAISTLLLAWLSIGDAGALTMEQAKLQCRSKFVPVVRQCVREKVLQGGGSPAQYIPGCRQSIMSQARDCVEEAMRKGSPDPEIELLPSSGHGRVVIMLSGVDGVAPYKPYAKKVADLGYYVVLIDGRAILSKDRQGGDRLVKAIAAAQGSANAKPGKVAVIGFSMGGGGALAYAERQPDKVATVIAYYPVTTFIAKVTDMKSFVDKFQVPLLAFAGAKDTFHDCCMLATIQSMKGTASELGKSMDLVVYPDAGHGFIKGEKYRAADADDAWKRTTAALSQYLGDTQVQAH